MLQPYQIAPACVRVDILLFDYSLKGLSHQPGNRCLLRDLRPVPVDRRALRRPGASPADAPVGFWTGVRL